MHYEGNIFRPPAEHDSILLQVTTGCSHNKCSFCGLYKDKKFNIKPDSVILEDLQYAIKHYGHKKRVFLCDGDALIIPMERLLKILKMINTHLSWLVRIGTYANAKSIAKKSLNDLNELKKEKLGIIYMGLESGDDKLLSRMNKALTVQNHIEAGKKVKMAGMKLSVTFILGLAGVEGSEEHAIKTGKALSQIDPNHAAALSLMVVPEMPLFGEIQRGLWKTLTPIEILRELRMIIEHTNLTSGIFSANHASNYLPLQARFPTEKEDVLRLIDDALLGKLSLKPEHLRNI